SGMISFAVSDSGKGIEPENIERIFQPFEQTREGRLKGGTGLGLSISRQYCSLLGGELVAESEIGQGSRFTFTIRAKVCMESEVETKGSDTATIGIKSGSAPRILVVDDKEANRDILVRMLQPLGFPATAASSGQEALDMVDSWAPDLILLDLIMPDLSGKDVLRILRTDPDKGNIRIIVLTASAQENDKDEVLSLGANAFIRKPFRQNDILDEIGTLFGLEYFHEARKSDDAQAVALTAQGLAERMAALPEDLIRRLSEGLNMGDLEEVKNLTAEMDSIDPVLAEAIRKMADDFSVGPLLDILQAKG
ncbi:MAG: response regulator, partial [Rectinemataceae bacterium]